VVTHRRDAHTAATALSPTDFKAESEPCLRAKYANKGLPRKAVFFNRRDVSIDIGRLSSSRADDEQKHLVTSRRRIAPRTPPARRPRRSF
jgi:hypothetical protein